MSRERTISVMIVDDHPVVREGLRALISRRPDMKVVAEAADGRAAVELATRHKPDVALLDLRLPEIDGVEAMAAIRDRSPETRVVVLTSFGTEEDVYRALRAGARAYLLKDGPREELIECIRSVYQGRSWVTPAAAAKLTARLSSPELTRRETDVLRQLAAGRSNKEIGATLGVAEGTVKAHVNQIFQKLGVKARTEAVKEASRRGMVDISRV